MDTGTLGLSVCFAIVVLSAATDIASRRIPNLLTLGGIALGFALHGAVGYADGGFRGAFHGLGQAGLGMLLCAAMPVFSFAKKQMGGGDVKLFAAIGALVGWRIGLDALAATFLVALVVVAPVRLVRAGLVGAVFRNIGTAFGNLLRPAPARQPYRSTKLPAMIFAPSILVGFCLATAKAWPLA